MPKQILHVENEITDNFLSFVELKTPKRETSQTSCCTYVLGRRVFPPTFLPPASCLYYQSKVYSFLLFSLLFIASNFELKVNSTSTSVIHVPHLHLHQSALFFLLMTLVLGMYLTHIPTLP